MKTGYTQIRRRVLIVVFPFPGNLQEDTERTERRKDDVEQLMTFKGIQLQ